MRKNMCRQMRLSLEAMPIMSVTQNQRKIVQSASPQLLLYHPSTELKRPLEPLYLANQRMHGALNYTCARTKAREEPRATCVRAEMVGYIKRRADTKEYLRLAPVTEKGRCVTPCDARRLPLEAIIIMSVTHYQ